MVMNGLHTMRIRLAVLATVRPSSVSPRARAQRYQSSLQLPPQTKPFYVTTPIFYVNSVPHIGHLYTLVLTDVFKRWAILRGKKAIMCTGTDEHGLKVQQAAAAAGQDVRAFCDQYSRVFYELAKTAEINNDHFIRTSEPEHKFAVQHFWSMLRERGYIYASKHEGWYSVSDECFYPKPSVKLSLNPSTGRKFMASTETGSEVEWISEMNYHFRLSAFKDRLLEFYSNNPRFIVPSTRMKEVIAHVESGLEDLSISRPVKRLQWGIPVPDDPSQTVYVWLDALVNYLTTTNYPLQVPGQEEAGGWPADIHVIGKDIVRFHGVYWPAFLMALDLPLPRQLLAHAHWTLGKEKMSKSRNNGVNPFFAMERFGVDAIRYFLIYSGGIKDDASYDNSRVLVRYKELKEGLGNLLNRIVRNHRWNVRRAIKRHEISENSMAVTHASVLKDLPFLVTKKIEEELDLGAALGEIMSIVKMTNRYLQLAAPWENTSKRLETDRIIFLCAESLRIVGILLQPYIPSKMNHLLDILGVADNARTFEHAITPDVDYGKPRVHVGKRFKGVLFPHTLCDF